MSLAARKSLKKPTLNGKDRKWVWKRCWRKIRTIKTQSSASLRYAYCVYTRLHDQSVDHTSHDGDKVEYVPGVLEEVLVRRKVKVRGGKTGEQLMLVGSLKGPESLDWLVHLNWLIYRLVAFLHSACTWWTLWDVQLVALDMGLLAILPHLA